MFVLDEADEMLSRGFKDQIYDVFRFMPQDIQVRFRDFPRPYLGLKQEYSAVPLKHTSIKHRFGYNMVMLWFYHFTETFTMEFYKRIIGK